MSTEQKQDYPFKGLSNEIIHLIFSKINEVKTMGLVSMLSTNFSGVTTKIKSINLKMATSLIPRPRHSEDHFNKLPNELILIILSKIEDVKTLFLVSMVSTKFASLVLQIKNVSIKMIMTPVRPLPQSKSDKTDTFFQKFFPTTETPESRTLKTYPRFVCRPISKFLSKFIFLEKVVVILPTTTSTTNSIKDKEVLKWTGHYDISKKTARFLLFCGDKSCDYVRAEEENEEYNQLAHSFLTEILHAYECVGLILMFNPNTMKHLKSAVITDASNENMVDILEECIAYERSCPRRHFWIWGQISCQTDYWDMSSSYGDFLNVRAVMFATDGDFNRTDHERKMCSDFWEEYGWGEI